MAGVSVAGTARAAEDPGFEINMIPMIVSDGDDLFLLITAVWTHRVGWTPRRRSRGRHHAAV